MSYRPEKRRARVILKALTKPAGDRQFPRYRFAALRQVLTALVCPLPCVGHVNDTGWHRSCEHTVNMTITALRGDLGHVLSQHRPAKVFGDDVVCACGAVVGTRDAFTQHQVTMISERGAK